VLVTAAHLEHAHRVALGWKRRLPPFVELDDLVGDAHLELVRALRLGRPARLWSSVIDGLRSRTWGGRRGAAGRHQLTGLAVDRPGACGGLQAVEAADGFAGLLSGLSALEGRVLALRYREGLTYPEVARTLGMTTVRAWRIHRRALGKLRRRLR